MTPWDEYLTAAQRLDAVRRTAAAATAEYGATVKAARDDLAAVRARQAIQQARLLDAAGQAGLPPPSLTPEPAELATAQGALGATPTPHAVRVSLRNARATLDTADAVLSGLAAAAAGPPRSARSRNTLIYGGYALVAGLSEVAGFLAVQEGPAAVLVLGCGLLLPFVVFALGWLTAGAFRPVNRTPGLGAALSLLTLAPLLAMVVWVTARALDH